MVQRIPVKIGLVPTSQEAGGTVHSQAASMTAPGSQPGFDGGTMAYTVSADGPPAPMFGAELPVSSQPGDGLPPRVPAGSQEGGRWARDVTGPGSEAGWVKTPAAS